ncbi:hypothetical protein HK405_013410 [Cladochytrium tenue]|nr:hypothetical protein HK405_013410 [Cladochytrium tenue]
MSFAHHFTTAVQDPPRRAPACLCARDNATIASRPVAAYCSCCSGLPPTAPPISKTATAAASIVPISSPTATASTSAAHGATAWMPSPPTAYAPMPGVTPSETSIPKNTDSFSLTRTTSDADVPNAYPSPVESPLPFPAPSQPEPQTIPMATPTTLQPPPQVSGLPAGYAVPVEFARHYELGPCLGAGGFGFVHVAHCVKRRCEVAVKFILRTKVPAHAWAADEEMGMVPNEVYVLRRVRHSSIIGFLDCFQDEMFFLLVTELHGGAWASLRTPAAAAAEAEAAVPSASGHRFAKRGPCDLFECIELLERFSEVQARHVFRQVAGATAYLEARGILHRDIKDENILIDDDFNVKLIDFGSASLAWQPVDGLFMGTLQYAAPEVLEGRQSQGTPCEVWSLACCLYVMLAGEAPFETLRDARAAALPLRPRNPAVELSPACAHLLAWMFQRDPARRPSLQQVLEHPWLSKGVAHH